MVDHRIASHGGAQHGEDTDRAKVGPAIPSQVRWSSVGHSTAQQRPAMVYRGSTPRRGFREAKPSVVMLTVAAHRSAMHGGAESRLGSERQCGAVFSVVTHSRSRQSEGGAISKLRGASPRRARRAYQAGYARSPGKAGLGNARQSAESDLVGGREWRLT